MPKQLRHFLQVGILLSLQFYSIGAPYSAEKSSSWQADWDATLQAAKKEGQIMIYAAIGPYHPSIFAQFQAAFPEIKVTLVHGSSSRISPRLFAERRAGKYLADVYLGGPTSLYGFLTNQLFDPLTPQLILPAVLDSSRWWEGKHFYIDAERKHIFVNEGSVSGFAIAVNTQLSVVGELELTLARLLDTAQASEVIYG